MELDLLDGLWPALVVVRLLGQCPVKVMGPSFRRAVCANYLYSALSALFLIAYIILKIYFMPTIKFDSGGSISSIIGTSTSTITFIALHFTFIWKRNYMACLMEKYSILCSPKGLKNKLTVAIGILFLSMLIIFGFELADYFYNKKLYKNKSKFIYDKIGFLDEFSNIISEFLFLAYVLLVENEMKIKVNDRLMDYLENNQNDNNVERIDSSAMNTYDKLIVIRLNHFRITRLTVEINDNFGITNLLNVASTFIWITYTVYSIINVAIQKEFQLFLFLSILTWLIVQLSRLCAIALICTKVMEEVNKTSDIINEILVTIKDKTIRQEMQLFLLQLIERKIKFHAKGFFSIDNSLIHSVIAGATTYIIILLQYSPSTRTNCS